MGIDGLNPSAWLLLSGILLDAVFGDPRYSLHPIRLMGTNAHRIRKTPAHLPDWMATPAVAFFSRLLALTWIAIPCLIIAAALQTATGLRLLSCMSSWCFRWWLCET